MQLILYILLYFLQADSSFAELALDTLLPPYTLNSTEI